MEICTETEILNDNPEMENPAEETQATEELQKAAETPDGPDAPDQSDRADTEEAPLPATVEESVTPVADGLTHTEMERLIAEAEARGYERGRNAGIEAWINESRHDALPHSREKPDSESEIMILNNMRRSVWD
ncbi:MAG: hypothetical protein K2L73_05885 [Muribaculaceae bacterium]|nr:hypothetical protein [Muribaculaceae bacterium]